MRPTVQLSQHKIKILSFLLIAVLFYFLKPVYGFFSHNGSLPLPPFGWHQVAENGPITENLHNPIYRDAASTVLTAMEKRRTAIGAASYSVAVAIKGEIVWAGAVGWADIEQNIKASPDTKYRIGSTSKAITGTALARLVQKGVLDLDTPISTYMPNLPNKTWADITPRMLASHMAGIAHYGQKQVEKDYLGLYRVLAINKHYDSMREALEIFDGTSLRSKPGTEFYYSSQGTVLLGAVMEAATGKPYWKIIEEEVLNPNHMNATIVAPPSSDGHEDLATSYKNRINNGQHEVRQWRPVDLSHRLPGGGFAATSSDLVRMGMAYFDESYITAETRDIFWTHQKLANGETNPQHYALGWRFYTSNIEGVGDVEHANHGGVSRGGQSWLMVIPEYEMAIAINANIKTEHFPDFGLLYKDIVKSFIEVDEQHSQLDKAAD